MTINKKPPLEWTEPNSEVHQKTDRIINELVNQAHKGDFGTYTRSDIERAVETLADVGSDETIDKYVKRIGETQWFMVRKGNFYVTVEALERLREEWV